MSPRRWIVPRLRHWVRQLWRFVWSRRAYRFLIRDWSGLPDVDALAQTLSSMRFTRNLVPLESDPPTGRILVIAPHPDDEIVGAGGTLIQAIDGGAAVTVAYLTSGKQEEAAVVEAEAGAVATRLGYQTEFLRLPLLDISLDRETQQRLVAVFDRVRPGVCFVPFLADDHDDHRRASHLLWLAWQADLLPRELEVWAYQVYTSLIPNVVVDVTAVTDRKAEAIRGWASQSSKRDWAHYSLGLNAYNVRFLNTARARYAEAFFVLPVDEYAELCGTYFSKGPGVVYSTSGYRGEGRP